MSESETKGWEVRTYRHALNAVRESRIPMPAPRAPVLCPRCGTPKIPELLVDVSGLPDSLTNGNDWACDGCWSSWERNRVEMAPGKIFREEHLYESQGAPAEFVARVKAILDHRDSRFAARSEGRPEPAPPDMKKLRV